MGINYGQLNNKNRFFTLNNVVICTNLTAIHNKKKKTKYL